jgi:hypothetical protein
MRLAFTAKLVRRAGNAKRFLRLSVLSVGGGADAVV